MNKLKRKQIFNIKNFKNDNYSRDPVLNLIGPVLFNKLNIAERENKALKIYNKRKLSKLGIGKKYERFLQYYYEIKKNWDVYNNGIRNGYKDLGRDLICYQNKTIRIIQAKYWNRNKTIFSNHIHQLAGSSASYVYCKKKFRDFNIQKYLCYRNKIDETAVKEAKKLKIKLEFIEIEETYPRIKCNISKNGAKIYHLPFDKYYDLVKIDKNKGEFYCYDVNQALGLNFKRKNYK